MNIQQQLAWEAECIERGTARYYANQDRLRDGGQNDQTDVVSFLLHQRLTDTAELIENMATAKVRGKGAVYNKLLRSATLDQDYHKVAYIGVKAAFTSLMLLNKRDTILQLCLKISAQLEADLKCQLFEAEYPAYYNTVVKSLADQNVTDYTHKHKVLMKKFTEFNLEWNDWTTVQKTQVGSKVLRCILTVFDDVLFIDKEWSRGKSTYKINTTVAFDEWAAEFEKERGFMHPYLLPLKIQPNDWVEGNTHGGYYTPRMCASLPFIKTKSKEHRAFVAGHNPEQHREAVNRIQKTSWKINEQVLAVQELIYERGLEIGMPSNEPIIPPPFPAYLRDVEKEDLTDAQKEEIGVWKELAKRAYGREKERKGKVLAFMQAHKLAKELRTWEQVYFAYNCDFRGRIYCATSGLSPQGADTAKGLLCFSEAKTLGESGIKWLAVQGANTYGYDKATYQDRVQWIRERESEIRRVVADPISSREFWGAADKPYQFLAFCFDWASASYGTDPSAKSAIPVGLDGSCNGLQHFSGMLRDMVGAGATNLIRTELPNDIYQQVSDVCTEKLRTLSATPSDTYQLASKWLEVGLTRKLAKRPVMTLPYGATRQSARTYILEYCLENWGKFHLDESHQFAYANYLTPILWESIGEVVVAAREAMDWLRASVGKEYTQWLTPLDFPVYQYYRKVKEVQVVTQLNGGIRLIVHPADNEGKPNSYQQKNGVSPNFVHSIDSTHMVLTINEAKLDSYAMIHDDYGTHAADIEKLFPAIRDTFHQLYTEHSPLQDWAEQVGADTDTMPATGTYDIDSIREAEYFFG